MRAKLYILLFIAVLAVSSASILVVLTSAPGVVSAFWRLTFSLPIVLLLYRPRLRVANIKLPLIAGFALSAHFALWMESLFHASVAVSTAIVCMHSIFSGIFSSLFGEKPKPNHVIGVIIAILGVYLLSGADFRADFIGIAFAFLGAVFGGLYFAIGRLARFEDFSSYIFLTYLFATVFALFICLLTGVDLVGYPLRTWLFFILLAVIPMMLGHTLLNYVLRYMHVVPVTASVIGEVVGSAILAYLILGQALSVVAYLYIVIILLGIAITLFRT
ncbi:DMT family transporter [Archaeoglobus profundus]|uniref:EamA domain-containing protein n=1 Tax=Archaeoglobus profundus (strain DSM 5631 / JCM 9629 / NBRC 100127 / Av18) TaxID=572546 RepID=D2RDT2_ARCPA|nr:DMT family transporter [Archaeoglobus profundus]ADB58276.1 protein of unknown function DUF6 transmembrane [Archaeoglobus profundus DSM 5631]